MPSDSRNHIVGCGIITRLLAPLTFGRLELFAEDPERRETELTERSQSRLRSIHVISTMRRNAMVCPGLP